MDNNTLNSFLEALKSDADLRNGLAALTEGDWDGIVKIAANAGFNLSKEELIGALPLGFFLGHGKNPEFGWSPAALPAELKEQLLTEYRAKGQYPTNW